MSMTFRFLRLVFRVLGPGLLPNEGLGKWSLGRNLLLLGLCAVLIELCARANPNCQNWRRGDRVHPALASRVVFSCCLTCTPPFRFKAAPLTCSLPCS
jgi:hypothetical protein